MFIVWGKKIVYRNLGYVADFCPICRKQRSFELKRIGSAGHVYYISAGEGELVGYQRTCQKCSTSFDANPTAYASISKKLVSLSELIRRTFPNIEQVLKDRLALEEKIQHAPFSFSPQDRHALIRSPFLLLSPKVERQFASTHLDREVRFSLIAAVALMYFGSILSRVVAPDAQENFVLIALVLSICLVLWQIALTGRRFMRRQIIPVLSAALYPLKPTESELSSVLAELKQLKHKMGRKLKLADLQAHLNQ